jgi:hypothetical protein
MNATAFDRMIQHVDRGGKTTTIVGGNGWSLSAETACTYLHDVDGKVSACLLQSSGRDDVVEVAEFFCQQVVLAETPSPRLQEMGIVGLAEGSQVVIVTYMEGMTEGDRVAVERALMSLSKKARHLGQMSDWPEGMFL